MRINLNNEQRRRLLTFAPLFLWIGVIFYLSSSSGSMSETSLFLGPLLQFIFPSASEETLLAYHGIIRKMAHFVEYAILAFLACRALRRSSIVILQSAWALTAIGLVILTASIDEINQSFNSSRTGSIADILLDILGGVAGAGFFYLLNKKRVAGSST